jgi:hypothetical protein
MVVHLRISWVYYVFRYFFGGDIQWIALVITLVIALVRTEYSDFVVQLKTDEKLLIKLRHNRQRVYVLLSSKNLLVVVSNDFEIFTCLHHFTNSGITPIQISLHWRLISHVARLQSMSIIVRHVN